MRKSIVIVLVISLFTCAQAQVKKCGIDTRALVAEEIASGATHINMLAKMTADYDRAALERSGIVVGAEAGDIVTLRVPVGALKDLEGNDDVLQYSISHRIAAPMTNTVRYDTRTDSVHHGWGVTGDTNFDGTGVYIGITDWGFDYTNPNLNAYGRPNWRIEKAWDHFRLAGPAPEGFTYGTEISGHADLTAAKGDTSNLYGYGTHGTHVAGIAAGRGIDGNYQGQAPNARLLLCSFGLGESEWMDGVAWMRKVAQDSARRLVVNSSWGMYSFSCIDGSSLLSQAINNWSDEGIVFCTSGGNNGDEEFHIMRTFNPDQPDTLRTIAKTLGYEGVIGHALIFWGEEGKDFEVKVSYSESESMWFTTGGNDTVVYDTLDRDGAAIAIRAMVEHENPYDQRPHIQIDTWAESLLPVDVAITAESGTVHAWNVANKVNHAGNEGMPFASDGLPGYSYGDRQYGVGEPACAAKCISVAAHISDSRDPADSTLVFPGALTSFSSHGPLISGVHKPEISAPGYQIVSSISTWTDGDYTSVFDFYISGNNYIWARMSGTSMSCPAVTGIVALLLQANPRLTTDQVRDIIFTTARNDSKTGALVANDSISNSWGWGKIDALKAINEALNRTGELGIDTPAEEGEWTMYPNPTTGMVTLISDNDCATEYAVYAIDGRRVDTGKMNGRKTLDASRYGSGIYIVRLGNAMKKLVVR